MLVIPQRLHCTLGYKGIPLFPYMLSFINILYYIVSTIKELNGYLLLFCILFGVTNIGHPTLLIYSRFCSHDDPCVSLLLVLFQCQQLTINSRQALNFKTQIELKYFICNIGIARGLGLEQSYSLPHRGRGLEYKP
jgi:hypothetical protein